jgi:hypothetical protein
MISVPKPFTIEFRRDVVAVARQGAGAAGQPGGVDKTPLAWLALALVISGAQNNRSVQSPATLSLASTPHRTAAIRALSADQAQSLRVIRFQSGLLRDRRVLLGSGDYKSNRPGDLSWVGEQAGWQPRNLGI